MIYIVLVDEEEKLIRKHLKDRSRETDNIMREEIIHHFLEKEGANDVVITGIIEEDE